MKPTLAHISPTSPRALDWLNVFGDRSIPVKSPIPSRAELPGLGVREVYEVNVKALDFGTRLKLVAFLSHRFNISPEEVDAGLDVEGCPILAEDVSVSFDPRLVM